MQSHWPYGKEMEMNVVIVHQIERSKGVVLEKGPSESPIWGY